MKTVLTAKQKEMCDRKEIVALNKIISSFKYIIKIDHQANYRRNEGKKKNKPYINTSKNC